jgi:7-carboxy-7-deazaguanine synthase
MTAEITLPVHERFHAFQGEGIHIGRRAFFIRTYGCPVKCPFCDSAGTWHPAFAPKRSLLVTVDQLVKEAVESRSEFVVLTGGEPLIQKENALAYLSSRLRQESILLHVETCGAYLRNSQLFDWITVSPKLAEPPAAAMLAYANEIKIIVESEQSVGYWVSQVEDTVGKPIARLANLQAIWLHPEWSRREDEKVLNAISREVLARGGLFRAGWQLHKLYKVDALDARSAPNVPLGGVQPA